MALVQKLQEGDNTPVLYTFYGKQYDYNDLAQAADQGLNEYLSTLKRGEKDSEDFRNAYANIMSGIKDGTITFEDGSFHDSQGRYTNAEKKAKDYYGLIANYIYNKMGKSNVYQKPEDPNKIKWDTDSVKKAVMRQIFNRDDGNLQDFLDLDTENNGVRSIANRSTYLANALQAVADNWDNTFQGYQDADKTNYINLLSNAAKAIRDGSIDAGDYLALSKAVGGVNFREMMATGTPTTTTTGATTGATSAVPSTNYKLKSASLNSDYSAQDIAYMTQLMSKVKSSQGLINILRNSFYNRNYRFARDPRVYNIFKSTNISSKAGVTATLNALYARGVLKQADPSNPNLMYIPGLRTKRGTAWVWDRSTNQITELQQENIPYLKAKLAQITSHKRGGILYASGGASVPDWHDNFTSFDPNKYTYEWGDQAYGMDKEGNFLDTSFGTTGAGYNQNRYTTDPNYRDFSQTGRDAARAIENSSNYRAQTDKILSDYDAYNNATDKSAFNEKNNLFLRYSKWYDSQQTNDANKFWNQDKLNTSWNSKGNNYYGSPTNPSNDIKERIRNLRNDQMISLAHNNFKATGTRYFYIDKNGAKQWVDPEIAKKYKLAGDPTKTTEGYTTWSDYEIIGPAESSTTGTGTGTGTGTDEGSKINRTEETKNQNNTLGKIAEAAKQLVPNMVGTGRLFDSLHTNNKIADTLRQSLKPVLQNTYELYSPVTGAFSEMQARNQQAANLRRQAATTAQTSDASLNAAQNLEANRQAAQYEQEGFLADDKEIKRTSAEARERQESNIARRTATANADRESINKNERELAELEANRLHENWQSRDNYLQGIENDLKEETAYQRVLRRQEENTAKEQKIAYDTAPLTRQQNYQRDQLTRSYNLEKQKLLRQYQSIFDELTRKHADDPNYDVTHSSEWYEYADKLNALEQQEIRDNYEMTNYFDSQHRDTYNTLYDNQRSGNYNPKPFNFELSNAAKNSNWYKRINGITTAKRGGKLSLSSIQLLNKVIR